MAADHIKLESELYSFFIEPVANGTMGIDKYIEKIRKEGEPVTEIEIKALCEAVQYDLQIHQQESPQLDSRTFAEQGCCKGTLKISSHLNG
jgi:hypothetical protein